MQKDSAQLGNSIKRLLRVFAINIVVVYSLYALAFGVYPQLAFLFATIKIAYTILISIANATLILACVSLVVVNTQISNLIRHELLHSLFTSNELQNNIFPLFDMEKLYGIEANLKGPIRIVSMLFALAIMSLAYYMGAYYLMVIELFSEVIIAYFLEVTKTTFELSTALNKVAAKKASHE